MTTGRPITPDEREAIRAMRFVSYPVGSWDKRFMRVMNASEDIISDNQAAQLWRLFIRYRRQIQCKDKERLLAHAESLAAPDLRKISAKDRDQARINQMKQEANA